MSLQFSDISNLNGIIQLIERELEFGYGDISGDTTLLKEITSDVNLAHNEVLALIFKAGGTWQFDDTNHTDYPIITTNIVSSQRDYTFTSDETGNLILDVYRVLVADSDGVYRDLVPRDQQTPYSQTTGFVDGQDLTGTPTAYDKTANGIFLDRIPNYNYTNGLKVYINREGYYFTTSDTTKKPGIPGLFHEYYVIATAYRYARRKSLAKEGSLLQQKIIMEQAIEDHFAFRERDVKKQMIALVEDNR